MFTDTHAHLSFPELADDLDGVLNRALAAGVTRIISIGTDLESSRRTIEIAGHCDSVYAAVGLHPGHVPNVGIEDTLPLAKLAAANNVVAIGETGLDYYRDARDNPRLQQLQKDLFRAHLVLARKCRLPVIIHNRLADHDVLEVLRAHSESLPPSWRPWGVMHCFAGDERFAFDCIEIGLMISFTGILTFKNADGLRHVARVVSLDHIMVETDAPYLAPVPHRGRQNEPSHIPLIAAALAQIKGTDVEEIARITTANAHRLFQLGPKEPPDPPS